MEDTEFYKQLTIPNLEIQDLKEKELPKKIGPYKIDGLLSKGGMSLIYLGEEPQTKKTLIVKVLSSKFVNHPEMVNYFLKESKIISLTDHPNIIKLFGQGEWEGGLYLATEFVQGVSLRQFILQQSLSLRRCIDIIMQVAYALCHLHSHGVIHRDLKPENILITENGDVKVIDFGIAQLHEEEKSASTLKPGFMGTLDYMSPEQKKDPLNISYSSDIYSLGIIAYELITGKLSYGIIHLSLLPKELRKIIEKAIATSTSERYPDIVNLITDLSTYLKSGTLEEDRPGTDQLKETMEILERASFNLSPVALPEFPNFEIGLAKYKGASQIGLYYDLIPTSESNFLFLIAESSSENIDSAIYLAFLRGTIRSELKKKPTTPFSLISWVAKLNEMITLDHLNEQFGFAALHIDCFNDKLSLVSCGLGHLLHIPYGSITPRALPSTNPCIGKELNADFFETSDNFNMGDILIFHSFDQIENSHFPKEDQLENFMMQAVGSHIQLSPQRSAEAILKQIMRCPTFYPQKNPKVLFSIQRVT